MRFQTQSESTECGLACIAIALEKLGAPVDLSEPRRKTCENRCSTNTVCVA